MAWYQLENRLHLEIFSKVNTYRPIYFRIIERCSHLAVKLLELDP